MTDDRVEASRLGPAPRLPRHLAGKETIVPRKRINREDWILAGIGALDERGSLGDLDEVCVDLGVTKGSFYTHFSSFTEWRAVVMARAAARAEPSEQREEGYP